MVAQGIRQRPSLIHTPVMYSGERIHSSIQANFAMILSRMCIDWSLVFESDVFHWKRRFPAQNGVASREAGQTGPIRNITPCRMCFSG